MAQPPQRTCVGCRRRAAQAELLRVAVIAGVLTVDPARRIPGRGAYVHRDPACLARAQRRRAWARALRSAAPLDAGSLE